MPFQNAPAIVACGAKICRDESIVVRYDKISGENFLMWLEQIGLFYEFRKRKKSDDNLVMVAFLFCCYQYFEPCKSFQRAYFHFFKPCIFA